MVCGRQGLPEAHYIPRSKGGLGIEQNIVTLCRDCHDAYDFGDRATMDQIGARIRRYLKRHYKDWSEDDLVYRKYGGKIDGV